MYEPADNEWSPYEHEVYDALRGAEDRQGLGGLGAVVATPQSTSLAGTTLMNELKNSQVFKDAVKGMTPAQLTGVLNRIDQAAKSTLGAGFTDKTKRLAFGYAYAAAAALQDKLLANPTAQKLTTTISSGIGIGQNIGNIIGQFKTGKALDASGIIAVASMSHQITMGIASVAKAFGGLDSNMMAEIESWSNLVVGCVGAYTSFEPYSATAACAMQLAGKLADVFSHKAARPDAARALFVPTGGATEEGGLSGQLAVIAVDAQRLAALLRYYYGISSYAQLFNRLKYYPYLDQSYPAAGSSTPPTAVDTRCMLAALAPQANNWDYSSGLLQALAAWMGGSGGTGLYDRDIDAFYLNDHDVDTAAVVTGADMFRDRAASGPKGNRPWTAWETFLYVDELCEFFGAVSKLDRDSAGGKAVLYQLLNYGLPVRLWSCRQNENQDCRIDWEDSECDKSAHAAYSDQCWTSLERCGILTGKCHGSEGLYPRVLQGNDCALKELGRIRLMAAWSYMHMLYLHGTSPETGMFGMDIIKDLPPPTDPAVVLSVPVDPRQMFKSGAVWTDHAVLTAVKKAGNKPYPTSTTAGSWMGHLYGAMRAKEAALGALVTAAAKAGAPKLQMMTGWKFVTKKEPAAGGVGGLAVMAGLGYLLLKVLR